MGRGGFLQGISVGKYLRPKTMVMDSSEKFLLGAISDRRKIPHRRNGKGEHKASHSGAEGLCQKNVFLNVVLIKNSNVPTGSPVALKTQENMIGALCTETSEYT